MVFVFAGIFVIGAHPQPTITRISIEGEFDGRGRRTCGPVLEELPEKYTEDGKSSKPKK